MATALNCLSSTHKGPLGPTVTASGWTKSGPCPTRASGAQGISVAVQPVWEKQCCTTGPSKKSCGCLYVPCCKHHCQLLSHQQLVQLLLRLGNVRSRRYHHNPSHYKGQEWKGYISRSSKANFEEPWYQCQLLTRSIYHATILRKLYHLRSLCEFTTLRS